jgi:hypothetical protein
VIAGILNRQGRTTAQGHRFEGDRVGICVAIGKSRASSPSLAKAKSAAIRSPQKGRA